jgi:hypothetical protein
MNATKRKNYNIALTIALAACVLLVGLGVTGAAASLSVQVNALLNGNFEQMALSDYQPIVHVQGPFYAGNTNQYDPINQVTLNHDSAPLQYDTIVMKIDCVIAGQTFTINQPGVTWNLAKSAVGSACYTYTYYGYVDSTSAVRTATITASPGVQSYSTIFVTSVEYSGIATTNPVDQTASNTGTVFQSGQTDTGTATSSTDSALYVGSVFTGSSLLVAQNQPSNGFTLYVQHTSSAYLEKIATSTGNANSGTNMQLSSSGGASWVGSIVVFKAAPASQQYPTPTPTAAPTNGATNQPTPTSIPTCTLTTDYSGLGIIYPDKGTHTYHVGETASLTAIDGIQDYRFSYWLINDGVQSTKIYTAFTTLPMTGDKSALAVFTSSATPVPGETTNPTVQPTAIPVATPTASPTETASPDETAPPIISGTNFSANELSLVSGLSGIALCSFGYAVVNNVVKPNKRG